MKLLISLLIAVCTLFGAPVLADSFESNIQQDIDFLAETNTPKQAPGVHVSGSNECGVSLGGSVPGVGVILQGLFGGECKDLRNEVLRQQAAHTATKTAANYERLGSVGRAMAAGLNGDIYEVAHSLGHVQSPEEAGWTVSNGRRLSDILRFTDGAGDVTVPSKTTYAETQALTQWLDNQGVQVTAQPPAVSSMRVQVTTISKRDSRYNRNPAWKAAFDRGETVKIGASYYQLQG